MNLVESCFNINWRAN